MAYREFQPHPLLRCYIDAYWTVIDGSSAGTVQHILPDCCADIIINLADAVRSTGGGVSLENEKSYLVGTMTSSTRTVLSANVHLIGIRFKAGGFLMFNDNRIPLCEVTDRTFEQQYPALIDLILRSKAPVADLDRYFLKRLLPYPPQIMPVINYLELMKGQVKVSTLSSTYAMSERKMERLFKQHVGVSARQLGNLFRFRNVLSQLQNGTVNSLQQLAFDSGYYDQAHLTNEMKRYTGLTPASWMKS